MQTLKDDLMRERGMRAEAPEEVEAEV